ncbi:MAG: thioredoxin [Clostridia bacterium]|jgi:thioredoxin 1|nr:thioredoxin [Clostridia bacterium]
MVRKVNAEEFLKDAKAADAAVVDFNATWCGPCRMLAPVLEAVSGELEGQVSFYSVDVDECPELAAEYRVQSVPCLVMMKKGEFVSQSIGFKPQAAVTGWIRSNL